VAKDGPAWPTRQLCRPLPLSGQEDPATITESAVSLGWDGMVDTIYQEKARKGKKWQEMEGKECIVVTYIETMHGGDLETLRL
jgi:hypothetical protein